MKQNKRSSATPARKTAAASARKKRSRGRPRTAQGVVGRHAILLAARQLLEKQPPHLVTIALIARKAGVDPALVRYYFADREQLLLAVVEHILADWKPSPPAGATPAQYVAAHLENMLEFSTRVRAMQRLMVEECAQAKSPAVRARIRDLNAHVVQGLARLLRPDGEPAARSPDALFLHVAMIGLCEFFAAAQAMILPLAPKDMSAADLAARYSRFIHDLLLDGIRKRLRPA